MSILFSTLQAYLQTHGYLIMFILMFIEGPIVAFVASFLAALGYFNIWIILPLFILGNQIPDILIFKLGGYLREKTIERYLNYFGLNNNKIHSIEINLHNNFIKTFILIKTIPPLPAPGILLSGYMKIPFKKFFLIDFIFNIGYAIIFISLGYYSGLAANASLKYFQLGELLIPLGILLTFILYYLIKFFYLKFEKNNKIK